MVYAPAEDSFLLEREIISYLNHLPREEIASLKILDMGSGSGIQAKACLKAGVEKENILCADINAEAIKLLKGGGFKAVKTNLFEKVKAKWDIIIFNPPYLPKDKYDSENDTTAGKRGYEIIVKFLEKAGNFLNKNGKIFLLVSSLSKTEVILKHAEKAGYKIEKLSALKMFFEELEVWKIQFYSKRQNKFNKTIVSSYLFKA